MPAPRVQSAFASPRWGDRLVEFVARGFGTGWAPKAPGTFGTLAGVALYWPLSGLPLGAYLAVTGVFALTGIWICGRTSRLMQVNDHPGIVWDEVVGFLVTMIGAPIGWLWLVLGFVLFRLFDITKPWPIRVVDRRIHGGLGIMLDDILAGIFASICLHAMAFMVAPASASSGDAWLGTLGP